MYITYNKVIDKFTDYYTGQPTKEKIPVKLGDEAKTLNKCIQITKNGRKRTCTLVNHADVVPTKPESLILSDLNWKYMCRSVVKGKNILLTGPSGCGKTMAVQEVAKAMPRPFYYFNLGATQDARSTLIGNTHYSPDNGTYVAESLFVKAIKTPNAIILLDELTRGSGDAWNILMSVLDAKQRYLRIDEHANTPTINVAPGVSFFATANIGAEYTATKVLDRAMLDRFQTIIEMKYLEPQESAALLNRIYPELNKADADVLVTITDQITQNYYSDEAKVSTTVSTRSLLELAEMLTDGFSLGQTIETCLYPLFDSTGGIHSERTWVKQLTQQYMPPETSRSSVFTPDDRLDTEYDPYTGTPMQVNGTFQPDTTPQENLGNYKINKLKAKYEFDLDKNLASAIIEDVDKAITENVSSNLQKDSKILHSPSRECNCKSCVQYYSLIDFVVAPQYLNK